MSHRIVRELLNYSLPGQVTKAATDSIYSTTDPSYFLLRNLRENLIALAMLNVCSTYPSEGYFNFFKRKYISFSIKIRI